MTNPQPTANRPQHDKTAVAEPQTVPADADVSGAGSDLPHEYGGPSGPEPTRFGDWERKGRCIDF